MKKALAYLLLTALLISMMGMFAFAAPNLEVDEDGFYKIASADDLIDFRNNYTVGIKGRLYADIDMAGKTWAGFDDDNTRMIFDGNGKTIRNMTRTVAEAAGNVGLFVNQAGNGDGTNSNIYNITFENCSLKVDAVSANSNIGIVGYVDRGRVSGITVKNTSIEVVGSTVEICLGMIAGRANWGYADAQVPVDGVVDAASSIKVTGSTNDSVYVGGIVGAHNDETLYIENASFAGTIETSSGVKAAIVSTLWGPATMVNCSTTTDLPLTNSPDNVVTTYAVSTADELIDVIGKINDGTYNNKTGIVLNADIDVTGKTYSPITVEYVGKFNGNGKTIKGIKLELTDVTSGRYGMIVNFASNANSNAQVINLTIKDSSLTITAAEGANGIRAGGFVGATNRALVENCHLVNSTVTVNGEIGGDNGVGGIVGHVEYATTTGSVPVYHCSTDADSVISANGSTTVVGGIAGSHWSADRLDINYGINYATVTSAYVASGIIGRVFGATSDDNGIFNSANYGLITAPTAAGFVALFDGGATGTIKAENSVSAGVLNGETNLVWGPDVMNIINGSDAMAVTNPLATDEIAAYFQTAAESDTTNKVRVVFVVDQAFLQAEGELDVTIVFTLKDDTTKTKSGEISTAKQDFELFKSVTADNLVYTAAEGDAIFGAVITGVPMADVATITVTANDYTATATVG